MNDAFFSDVPKKQRKTWKKDHCALLKKFFFITSRTPPSKIEIEILNTKNKDIKSIIAERGWKSVKYYVWSLAQQHHRLGKILNF